MIEIIMLALLLIVIDFFLPPRQIDSQQSRQTDKKMRREFVIYYRNESCREGVLYREGNIMMNDGELFSRLDQLIDNQVIKIQFKK